MKIYFSLINLWRGLGALALLMGAWSTAMAADAPATPTIPAAEMPTIYIVSDSTANNNAGGAMGWGKAIADYFDPTKVHLVNSAIAARSSRSYMVEGHWDQVLAKIKAGDYVLLQFGHNDTGTPNENPRGDRPSLPGLGEETVALTNADSHQPETVHTYGWYMRKYIADAQAKGAHVVVVTVTVRDIWTNPNAEFGTALTETANIVSKKDNYNPAEDKVERGLDDGHGHNYADECKEIAKTAHVPLVDLTDMNADKFEKMGREQAKLFYQTQKTDHTHTNPAGADFNAASIISGLKALKGSPFVALLSDKGKAVPPSGG
jgi:lysophospholipase L1-like esterase